MPRVAVTLRRALIQEMVCSPSEAADSSPGHLNCAGTPDSQGRVHMKQQSRKSRHTRGVMLGMLRHSSMAAGGLGSRGAQSEQ